MASRTVGRVTYGPGGYDPGMPDDNVIDEESIVVETPDAIPQDVFAMRSPNGTVYDVTISNAGALVITLRV